MELKKRVISGIVMAVVFAAAILLGSWALLAFTGIISLLAMIDVSRAFKAGGYNVSITFMTVIALLIVPSMYFFGETGYLLLCALAFCIIEGYVVFEKQHDFKNALASLFMLVYPLLFSSLFCLLAVYDVKNGSRTGTILLVSSILYSCVSDIFAYFGGRFFGKRKLCPEISPKKTVAGSIASVIGGGISGVGLCFLFSGETEVPVYVWIAVGLVCGILSQFGDLFASLLKRFCNIKDYGKYIPGHGGVMDRMDSISACLIFVMAVSKIAGMI